MKVVLTIIILNFSLVAFSQDYSSLNMDKLNGRGGLKTTDYMIGKPMPPGYVTGSYHLYDEFYIGGVLLKDDRQIKDYPLKVDLYNSSLEIDDNGTIKDLSGIRINKFWWYNEKSKQDQKFTNCDNYTIDDTKLVGFFEVLDSGKYQLLIRHSLNVKQPTYVEGLNMGDRDAKFLKKKDIYLSNPDKQLLEFLKKNIKKTTFFKDDGKKVKTYLKENKVNANDIGEVRAFVRFINQ